MIFDTVMLRDELDMLECRLYEMQDHDVRHVLTEAAVDHRGNPKPLWFSDNRERFAPWKERITSLVVHDLPDSPDPWVREHAQRDAARPLIQAAARAGDVVLIADVDEIPSASALDRLDGLRWEKDLRMALVQRVFAFAADWELPEAEPTSLAVSASLLDAPLGALRDARYGWGLANAGWHLSWLGGNEAISAKLRSHCHEEYDAALKQGVAQHALYELGRSIWPGTKLRPVDVDETWPRYIYERRCPPSWFRPRS